MQSITLQTSDSSVIESGVLGRLGFAASSESDGADSVLVAAIIEAVAEGNFTQTSNATSLVFSTASSSTAEERLKITSEGHFVPFASGQYDLGSPNYHFRNIYADNIIGDYSGQLDGNLDLNGYDIVGTGNITIDGDVEANQFMGNLRGAIYFTAQAGEALTKGDVVYISGISGNKTVVSKADANDSSKMPAFGIADETVNNNANVNIITFGSLYNIDTDTPDWDEGDELYVSNTAGVLTKTAPTGESSQIQKIAKVTRRDNSAGSIKVMGAGRTNATPNLNEGRLFVGNSSNQAVADGTIHVDISNSRVGIGTDEPTAKFEVVDGSSKGFFNNGFWHSNDTDDAGFNIASKWIMHNDTSDGNTFNLRQGSSTLSTSVLKIGSAVEFYPEITFNDGNGYFDFRIKGLSDSNLFFVDGNNGKVGIGTDSPDVKLHIEGTAPHLRQENTLASSSISHYLYSDGVNLGGLVGYGTSYAGGSIFGIGASGVGLFSNNGADLAVGTFGGAGNIRLGTNSTERVRIDGFGNVGIGTPSPAHKLDIRYPAGGGMALIKDSDSNDGLLFGDMAYSTSDAYQGIKHVGMTGSSDYMMISEGLHTLMSAKGTAGRVYIRGGGNYGSNQILVYGSSGYTENAAIELDAAAGKEIVVNQQGRNVDFRVESNTDGSLLFTDASADKVGIGTASPSTKLHVVGSGNSVDTGILHVNDPSSGGTTTWIKLSANSTYDPDLIWHIAYGDTSIFRDLEFRTSFSAVPEVTIEPSGTLNVNGNGSLSTKQFRAYDFYSTPYNIASAPAYSFANDTDTGMWLASANNLCWSTAGIERLRIDSNGNVGIGTASPSEKLHVSGNALIDGTRPLTLSSSLNIASSKKATAGGWEFSHDALGSSDTNLGGFGWYGTNDSLNWYWIGSAYDSTNNIYLLPNGNCGIGTYAPSVKLDVDGQINSTNASNNKFVVKTNSIVAKIQPYDATSATYIGNETNHKLIFRTNNSDRVIITNGGDVGIGVDPPSEKLDVNGKIKSTLSYTAMHSATNLAVGWYTVAVNYGNRAIGRFGLTCSSGGRHQGIIFYASHFYGQGNQISVLHNNRYSLSNPVAKLRIKEGLTYDGCLLQVYIDDAINTPEVYLLNDNINTDGWVVVDWVADGTNPGGVANFAALTNVAAEVDLDTMDFGTTGQTSLDGPVVINEGGSNNDFRVEGDADPNLLFTDASADRVGIKTSSPDRDFHVNGETHLDGTTIIGTGLPSLGYRLTVDGNAMIDQLNINGNFTFPTTDGSAGQSLVTDGAGNVAWSGVSGGGGSTSLGTLSVTSSQSLFNMTDSYSSGGLAVFLNGVKLVEGTDFSETSSTSFTLTSPAASGDIVEYVAYGSTIASTNLQKTGDTMTGNLTVNADLIVKGYKETHVDNGNTGTSQTIAITNSTLQTYTLNGNCTFTMPTADAGRSFTIFLKTGTGSFTATFTGVKWPAGSAPTITTTASRMDILTFYSDGTNWYGNIVQEYTP